MASLVCPELFEVVSQERHLLDFLSASFVPTTLLKAFGFFRCFCLFVCLFAVLGLELRAYTLSYSTSPFL
jgi:hypothetical protein